MIASCCCCLFGEENEFKISHYVVWKTDGVQLKSFFVAFVYLASAACLARAAKRREMVGISLDVIFDSKLVKSH